MKKRLCFLCFLMLVVAMAFSQGNPIFQKADSLFLARDYAQAKIEYESVLKSNEAPPLTWNRLAFSCYILGSYDDAVTYFDKSLTLNPPDQLKNIILIRLAKTYGVKKDKEKALANLRKSIDAGYMNLNDIENDPNLQFLKSDPEYAKIKEVLVFKLNPCMGNSQKREFDFWVGDWNVFDAKTNRLAGTNSIHIASGGCMLLENWADITQSNSAKSMTYVNPDNGKWEQLFIDNSGQQVMHFTDGVYKDGVMKFMITMKGPDGKEQTGEFVFEKKENGEVRQFQRMTPDGGKTWNMLFDLIYRKK